MFDPKNYSRILTIDDSADESFLRTAVLEMQMSGLDKKEIERISGHMRKMMVAHRGVGLSANQVGLSLRLFVAQLPDPDGRGYEGKFYTIINPVIFAVSKKTEWSEEGCLSIPLLYGEVERAYKITVKGFDKNLRPVTIKAEGYLARIMQHEIDHLNGVLFIDKARNLTKINDQLQITNDQPNPKS